MSKLRPRLTYANVVSTICLFIVLGGSAFAAATVITGKNVKNGSLTGKDVKNSSLTGADLRSESVNSSDVRNGALLGQDFAPGQLPQGPQGPKGDTGAKGDKGEPGTDASINGVAAGGDLTGTFPNPTIADGKVTTAKLAPGIQEATIVNVARGQYYDNNAGAIGPFSGPLRFLVNCGEHSVSATPTNGMLIGLQSLDTGVGQFRSISVRGTNTVRRSDQELDNLGSVNPFVNTENDVLGTGNDSGTGNFIAHTPSATVSGTFSYLIDATHCELLASMELMQ
jgi:hypothetical protein